MNVRLIKAEGLRRVLVALFFAAYIFTMTYSFVHAAPADRGIYAVMLVLAPFGIWCEVVRYAYTRASDALNLSCDPEKCLKMLRFVKKADFMHQFQLLIPYLEGFATFDLGELDKVEPHLAAQTEGLMTAKRKLDFEYNDLLFSLYAASGRKEEMNEAYATLQKIFSMAKRTSPDIVSLQHFIDGTAQLENGTLDAAACSFEQVLPEQLKPRTRAYYYQGLAHLYAAQHQEELSAQAYQNAHALAPKFTLIANRRSQPSQR